MEHEGLSFPEAVEQLAQRAGVSLPEQEMTPDARRQADQRARLKDMNKLAAGYFHYLLKTERGARAMEYLKNRGLSEETMTNFGLGYADVYSDDLYKYLKGKGYTDEELKDSGLVNLDEKRGGTDRFWNRVMFPIIDANNRVIGFGGRVMGDGKPKYINTQDTLVFDKSRNLYGLNLAKKSRRPGMIFCEGYMDVIAMHQAGFDNAVASLGTALTMGQINLVKRYTDRIYLAYDSDEAGTKAALRALELLREFELPARVISLKPYKDPDELIRAQGKEEFQRRIDTAQSGIMFEIALLYQQYPQEDPQERTHFQKEAAKRLSRIPDPLERGNYIESVAEQYHMEPDYLKEWVTHYGIADTKRADTTVFRAQTATGTPQEEREKKQLKAERLLLTWLINETSLFDCLKGVLSPDDFFEPVYHDIAQELFQQYEANGQVQPAAIMNHYQSKEEHEKVSGIMQQQFDMEVTPEEKSKVVTELVRSIRNHSVAHQLEEAKGDLAKTGALMQEKNKINKIIIHL
jgi:DNA primase